VIAVFRKRRTQSEINRFPRREVLRGELGLALASDGIEIAPDLAGRDRRFGRVVLAQKRCQMRLHDDSGSTNVHGAAFALEYLHVGVNAPQGNAGAQSTDRAACNRDLHTRLVAQDGLTAFIMCATSLDLQVAIP
jgi:hypothetical protein